MFVIVLSMLICLAASAAVLGYVVVQARREGRDTLTPYGRQMLSRARRHNGDDDGDRDHDSARPADSTDGSVLTGGGRDHHEHA